MLVQYWCMQYHVTMSAICNVAGLLRHDRSHTAICVHFELVALKVSGISCCTLKELKHEAVITGSTAVH